MPQYAFEGLRPEYARLWTEMRVLKADAANVQAKKIIAAKTRYRNVERKTGVPWFVIGALHQRESNGSFSTWLHNGDPMKRNGEPCRTVNVPPGRPPNPDCTWEDGAVDALVLVRLNEVRDWGPEHVAYAAEKYNGFGYRHPARNIPSPYLWGATSVQKPGKFVRDGVYDSSVMDSQIGVMAVLRQIMEMDTDAKFTVAEKPQLPPPPPPPIQKPIAVSPKAVDTESNVPALPKSETMWGGIVGYVTSIFATIAGFFDKLTNGYALAAFIVILILASVAAYLVITGRLRSQAVIKHLSQDDTQGAKQ